MMKTDIALGLLSLSTQLLGQAAPDYVPGMVSQFGALGLVFWMVIHLTMVTIPGMEKRHAEATANLLAMHRAERAEMVKAFNETLEQKRQDYKEEIDQQRQDFEAMLTKFSCRAAQNGSVQ